MNRERSLRQFRSDTSRPPPVRIRASALAFAAADDVTLCIRPTAWRSWSAADLDAQLFGGVLGASPEKWFRPVDV